MARNESETRQHILQAALKRFAQCGYAATSVQDIVDDAGVSKPALYYHFEDKVGLYRALVDQAHEERIARAREAADQGGTVPEKLLRIAFAVFKFARENRDLTRLCFASAFGSSGEVPEGVFNLEKGRRMFDFICSLIKEGQRTGELDPGRPPQDLAFSFQGPLTLYAMVHTMTQTCSLDDAQARAVVEVFLRGAGVKPSTK